MITIVGNEIQLKIGDLVTVDGITCKAVRQGVIIDACTACVFEKKECNFNCCAMGFYFEKVEDEV